ncbi:MAG: ATP-binding protein [Candidatus Heimdallarchaeum endolithica]|uniref:ATP-binding protein n=1 Tax=Candidatus Heimdallarchaeum endolithica TaxID=2876572 RepID=A0A9Y1FPF5_9ARCH|nr:MAG: ATP-binding protein [Candidatus Heimdallarchaeum endolithica]
MSRDLLVGERDLCSEIKEYYPKEVWDYLFEKLLEDIVNARAEDIKTNSKIKNGVFFFGPSISSVKDLAKCFYKKLTVTSPYSQFINLYENQASFTSGQRISFINLYKKLKSKPYIIRVDGLERPLAVNQRGGNNLFEQLKERFYSLINELENLSIDNTGSYTIIYCSELYYQDLVRHAGHSRIAKMFNLIYVPPLKKERIKELIQKKFQTHSISSISPDDVEILADLVSKRNVIDSFSIIESELENSPKKRLVFNNIITHIQSIHEFPEQDLQFFHQISVSYNMKFLQNPEPPKPKYTFSEIGGNEKLKYIILDSYKKAMSDINRRGYKVLLYGPPGTGKTVMAVRLCDALGLNVIHIERPSDIMERYVGSSAANLATYFERARLAANMENSKGCALIFDDIDTISHPPSSSHEDGGTVAREEVLNTLLSELEGETHSNNKLLIVFCTNHPDKMDRRIFQRIDRSIFVGLPYNIWEYQHIIEVILRNELGIREEVIANLDLEKFAQEAMRKKIAPRNIRAALFNINFEPYNNNMLNKKDELNNLIIEQIKNERSIFQELRGSNVKMEIYERYRTGVFHKARYREEEFINFFDNKENREKYSLFKYTNVDSMGKSERENFFKGFLEERKESTVITKATFKDIKGLDEPKVILYCHGQSMLTLSEQQQFMDHIPIIILFGPPGCGKTMLISALKNFYKKELNVLVFNLKEIITPEDMHEAIDTILSSSPCFAVFDEADIFLSDSHYIQNKQIINVLKERTSSLSRLEEHVRLIFLTNLIPSQMNKAIKSRSSDIIKILPPETKDVYATIWKSNIEKHLKNKFYSILYDEDIKNNLDDVCLHLGQMSCGRQTPRDIKNSLEALLRQAIVLYRENKNSGANINYKISKFDIIHVIPHSSSNEFKESLERYIYSDSRTNFVEENPFYKDIIKNKKIAEKLGLYGQFPTSSSSTQKRERTIASRIPPKVTENIISKRDSTLDVRGLDKLMKNEFVEVVVANHNNRSASISVHPKLIELYELEDEMFYQDNQPLLFVDIIIVKGEMEKQINDVRMEVRKGSFNKEDIIDISPIIKKDGIKHRIDVGSILKIRIKKGKG